MPRLEVIKHEMESILHQVSHQKPMLKSRRILRNIQLKNMARKSGQWLLEHLKVSVDNLLWILQTLAYSTSQSSPEAKTN